MPPSPGGKNPKSSKKPKKLKNKATCFRCEAPGTHPNLPRRNMGTVYRSTMRKSLAENLQNGNGKNCNAGCAYVILNIGRNDAGFGV